MASCARGWGVVFRGHRRHRRRECPTPTVASLGGCTPLSLTGQETPQEHVRTALMLLDDLERELRGLGFILPADTALALYEPLAAARARLWKTITTLEGVP
jgi:hypothetical protein